MAHSPKKTILSGMRPTGKLHLGNWTGALENWIRLQPDYHNFRLVADYHMLTTNPDTTDIEDNSIEMVMDWLAAGIDPTMGPIFRQSKVKEHAELFLIFSMLVTKARLERNPAVKEQVRDLNIESIIYGHLGYPILQAADILLYKGEVVPVGDDQMSHIEITREIARSFNRQYDHVFPEPEGLLTQFSRLPGLNGIDRKMSKSENNTILLSDSPDVIGKKLRGAVTDPAKVRKNDPGHPAICLVYTYHEKFNATETEEIREGCESGTLGCVECKRRCTEKLSSLFAAHRERRIHYEERRDEVYQILEAGEAYARTRAVQTMEEVRDAMNLG